MKKKILIISDHALYHSGVGIQSKYLCEGLVKTNKYKIFQLGAALKHIDYNLIKVNDDFYIRPIDGFGNKDILTNVMSEIRPDGLILFSDPRFFKWIFEMIDEIKKYCPILWWHVWDNDPYPEFNESMYSAIDAINCHSYLTYRLCSKKFSDKSMFIPHSFPQSLFYPLDKKTVHEYKKTILRNKNEDLFVCLWINRNCPRKRPADILESWKMFIDLLSDEQKSNVCLIMHTNPKDQAGVNLELISNMLGLESSVIFSQNILTDAGVNILHNISDVCLNISYNEGFGLSTLASMMTGKPIIASKTGGLYRQVIDHNDFSENGVGLDPIVRTIASSENVPYIYKDYVSCKEVAFAIKKIFDMSKKERKKLEKKVLNYVSNNFSYEKTIDLWVESLEKTIKSHKLKI